MYRGRRGQRTRGMSSRSGNRGGHDGTSSGRKGSSFNISADGSEFYYSCPDKMKVDYDVMKNYKSSLKCIGGYSVDDEQNFCNDKSYLSFLNTDYLPQEDSKQKVVNFDLNTAGDDEKEWSGTLLKSYDNFFSWIISNNDKLTGILRYETKFVFLKNVFRKLIRIPYGYPVDLNFYAVYLNGVVYLLNNKNDEPKNLSNPKISRWGHKFEQFLTYGENVKEGVVCNRDYRCVMTAKIGPHNLLFSATTDCFNPDLYDPESPDPSSTVMFKCISEKLRSKNSLERFRMYEWCFSLAFLKIPHVLVGFRTSNGIVELLKLYTEDDLCRHGKPFWDINVGFTFAENVLSFIEKTTKAKPGTVFSFQKREYTACIKAEEADIEDFPPKWFTEELNETATSDN